MRLIDANDIEYFTEKVGCGKFDYTRRYLIDALPTVDAVPVVHGMWELLAKELNARMDAERKEE